MQTITSYGVELADLKTDADARRRIRDAFASRPPDTHFALFKVLKYNNFLGFFIFVHASVDPIKPFEEQSDADFLWVRDDFLLDTAQLPFRVVHGHTPQDAPLADNRRIGLDTHAYLSCVLTAARLRRWRCSFLANCCRLLADLDLAAPLMHGRR